MKLNQQLYITGGDRYSDYVNWLTPLGIKVTSVLDKADIVFFAGGEDVNPALYGEKPHPSTCCSIYRDQEELKIFANSRDKYKIGVCRGGQFLTAMSGYKLVQHSGHPYSHKVKTYDGLELDVTSSHHQQFLLQPNNLREAAPYKLIAWAEKLSPFHFGGNGKYDFPADYKEPDVVAYDNKSLAIQMHPEWIDLKSPTIMYLQKLVTSLLKE